MLMQRTLVALVLGAALAGCVATPDESDDPAPTDPASSFLDPIDPYHDHSDAADHNFSTPGMRRLAYLPLGESGPHEYIGEITTFGDHAFVAIEGGRNFNEDSGFNVVDVSDPTDPVVLARTRAPYSTAHDVKTDPSGRWVYQGSQYGAPPGPAAASAGVVAAYNNGILIWDAADRSNPVLTGFVQVDPNGCHMLSVGVVDGDEYVFCATISDVLHVFQVAATPDGGRTMVSVATYAPTAQQGMAGSGAHDMTFQDDPLTGEPILVVSSVTLGVRVLDVSQPSNPVELMAWQGEDADHFYGQIHSAMATLVDGRRIVVATPELYTNETAVVFFIDATDYGQPQTVAEWLNPGGHNAFFFTLTTHQVQIVEDRLYLTHNHGGVWVLDIPAVLNGTWAVLGYYLPHEQVVPVGTEGHFVPYVWDVDVHRGAIYASDRQTGLYVLHYEEDVLGDADYSSFA